MRLKIGDNVKVISGNDKGKFAHQDHLNMTQLSRIEIVASFFSKFLDASTFWRSATIMWYWCNIFYRNDIKS